MMRNKTLSFKCSILWTFVDDKRNQPTSIAAYKKNILRLTGDKHNNKMCDAFKIFA